MLAHDIDEVAVEKNYRQMVATGEQNIYPLLLDLRKPALASVGRMKKEIAGY